MEVKVYREFLKLSFLITFTTLHEGIKSKVVFLSYYSLFLNKQNFKSLRVTHQSLGIHEVEVWKDEAGFKQNPNFNRWLENRYQRILSAHTYVILHK